MRVALISPRGPERYHSDQLVYDVYRRLRKDLIFALDDLERMPHVGLLTLAGYLPEDWEVHYIDEDYLSPEAAEEELWGRDYDLVLLTAINTQAYRCYALGDEFMKRGATVLIGGLHPTALPDEALPHCHAVCVGEGEGSFQRFLEDYRRGEIRPVYRPMGYVDLATVPAPRLELIPDLTPFKTITLYATRGCPRGCDYCYLPGSYGPRPRHKTVDQVIREMEKAIALYPPGEPPFFQFADENMLLDRRFAKDLLREMRHLNVVWEAFSDISVGSDDELLGLLAEAHCLELQIGLETDNTSNFEGYSPWKARTVPKYRDWIRNTIDAGVGIQGLFIAGFDNDDLDVFQRMRDYVYSTDLYCAEVAALTPFPGTPFYWRMKREGRLLTENWERYTWIHVNFRPAKMTPEQLMEGIMWLFVEFTAPEMIERRLAHFRRVFGSAGLRRGPAPAVPAR